MSPSYPDQTIRTLPAIHKSVPLFHYGIIYGYTFTSREQLFYGFFLSFGIELRINPVEHLGNARCITAYSLLYGLYIPYKDPCIPEIIPGVHIVPCRFQVRFLFEFIHSPYILIHLFFRGYISVSRFRAARSDTYGYNSLALICHQQCLGYHPAEFIRIDNQCIRRSHYDIGVRVVFLDFQQAYVMQGAVLRATGSVSI